MNDRLTAEHFDFAPTPMWVQDLSAVRQKLTMEGVTAESLDAWIAGDPDRRVQLIGRIRMREINQQGVRVFGGSSEKQLADRAHETWSETSPELFIELITELLRGRESVQYEFSPRTLSGERLVGRMSIQVLPSARQDWSRVLYTFEDRTEAVASMERLRRIHARNEAVLKLPALSEDFDEETFFEKAIELAEALTESTISFMHVVHTDPDEIELVAWSLRTREMYRNASYTRRYPVSDAGVWADSIRHRTPIIVNDYEHHRDKCVLPEGHAALRRILIVPILEDGRVVLIAGVGNKERPFDDDDVETLAFIATNVWRLALRKRLHRSLEESQRRASMAEAVAKVGSWEWSALYDEFVVSAEFARQHGLPSEASGVGFDAFLASIHEEDRERVRSHFADATNLGSEFDVGYRVVRASEQERWVQARGTFVRNEDGEVLSAYGSVQDASERVIAERKLRRAAAVFHSTSEGVCITDLGATIIDVNRAFTVITGYTSDEVVGKNPSVLQSGRHDAAFYEQMWRALAEQGEWRGEVWNRRKNGTVYPEILTISTVIDSTGAPAGYVGVFGDITEVTEARADLERLAHHDPLTGLPNRLLLDARLEQAVRQALRKNERGAVIFIDRDGFKNANDSLGHQVGDALLVEAAARLRGVVRDVDTVARLSGDEFVVVFEGLDASETATPLVERLIQEFGRPFNVMGQELRTTASVGVSIYPDDATDASALLRNADAAMYKAKEEGRNTWRFYTSQLTASAFEHIRIANALHHALERNEFYLLYQPQIDLVSGHLAGLEALLRWEHPELGLVSPTRFIPVAESSGFIAPIGEWVLRRACVQARAWLDRGLEFGRMAVNVSGIQLRDRRFTDMVRQALDDASLPGDRLELELTESFVMNRDRESRDDLLAIRDLGVVLAIDDFGTGYSSLSYLKSLPIHRLKIDREFVKDIPGDEHDLAICEAILALGRALDLSVVAEGVESESQVRALVHRGCELAQGFHYARPLTAEGLEDWLELANRT